MLLHVHSSFSTFDKHHNKYPEMFPGNVNRRVLKATYSVKIRVMEQIMRSIHPCEYVLVFHHRWTYILCLAYGSTISKTDPHVIYIRSCLSQILESWLSLHFDQILIKFARHDDNKIKENSQRFRLTVPCHSCLCFYVFFSLFFFQFWFKLIL